jgi:enoyl-[acyl-carrier protein] reductase II
MNNIAELFGVRYPIFQGGMAWVAEANLAAAVSNGGGIGLIAAGSADADWVRGQIAKARTLTDKPFGVNVMLMNPAVDEVMQVIREERPALITTGAGNPGKYIEGLKEAGTKVVPVVSSVALAIRLERTGADALIAEGLESGGHIGELSTMALVPQVADAVSVPVIAAGGIADGRGVAAAFMLGASGVQVGTRFLSATECIVSQPYKDRVIAAKDSDTVVTGRNTGHPVRVLKNKLTREALKMEKEDVSLEEYEAYLAGSLRKAVVDGDVDYGSLMSGQIAGLVKKQQPAAEIIAEMFAEAKDVLSARGGAFSW